MVQSVRIVAEALGFKEEAREAAAIHEALDTADGAGMRFGDLLDPPNGK